MAGIGLSVMHDANHRAYSKNVKVNKFVGFVINFLGGYHVNWRIQHNVLHHSYTNIHQHDEDLESPAFRFSPDQPRHFLHRFQAFYAIFFYGIMNIYWITAKDFAQLARYSKTPHLKDEGLTYRQAMTHLVLHKIWYFALTLVLPIILLNIPWWQTLVGFLTMQVMCGIMLALIFQPAHVVEETNFYAADNDGNILNNWAIHQMRTTANFANRSRFFSWFVGGLNFQIEHHLFPNICHIHYKKIAKIVKETATEFNIPYYEHKTFLGALGSHFKLLHQLGTGTYDRNLVRA